MTPDAKNGSAESTPLVYVVDDESLVCMLVEMAVSLSGYRTQVFTDPVAAWNTFDKAPPGDRPAILITDYKMPEINGAELIERCLELKPELKTILISGIISKDVVGKMRVKPHRFLAKPFYPQELVKTMEELVGAG